MPRRRPPVPTATGDIPLLIHSYVYKVYDAHDVLLYVGVTDDLFMRLHSHRTSGSPWIYQAHRLAWETYPDRQAAERAETHAIETLLPVYNVRDNHRAIMARKMGHSRLYSAQDWQRLALAIRARRAQMRRSQRSIAGDSRIPLADLRQLEAGESTSYEVRTLDVVEYTLGWRPGSFEAILAGGEPVLMGAEEIRARAFQEYELLAPQAG